MNELANFVPPYSAVAYSVPPIPPQGTGVPCGPIPNDIYDSYLRRAPVSPVKMMTHANSTAHRLASTSHISVNSKCEANFAKLKEDLANMMNIKLGVDTGSSRLYQKTIFFWIQFGFLPCWLACS
jgi:hypothetical protein